MPNTYVALRTETVAVATPTITFTSIPSGYTDLVLVMSVTNTGAANSINMKFNSDSASNYSFTDVGGNGSAAGSWRASNQNYLTLEYAGGISSTQATYIVNIMNYSNTTTYKTVLTRANNTAYGVDANVGLWRKTPEAINRIDLQIANATNFAVGSTFNLYGIANADQGSAKATGGIITEDSQYWYHTFGASGAFVPKQSLTCDVLVVAGGGSGGGGGAGTGGGGAGGLLYYASQSLTAISHNVTVGGGGATTSGETQGNSGSNSQFAALTASVGGGGGAGSFNSTSQNGLNGGSGGGAGAGNTGATGGVGGTRTTGQGNDGGSTVSGLSKGGGGGGAGAAGASGTTGTGGNGISTYSSWGTVTGIGQNISGTYWLAGGGGGAPYPSGRGIGGNGGGGSSGEYDTTVLAVAGTANTGGGGGGGSYALNTANARNGRAGGSGVVIIRYSK